MKKTYFFLIFALLSMTKLQAESWVYSNFYPWAWLPQSSTWIYVPNNPQKVWDDTLSEWVANPMLREPFDIEPNFAEPLRKITLNLNPDNVLELDYNLSGSASGYITLNGTTVSAEYEYSYNAIDGTALFYIKWNDVSWEGSVALQLDFNASDAGVFIALGDFGMSSCSICEFSGDFLISPITF